MPANPKYLTQSKSQRIAKISASVLGGFLIASILHLSIALWLTERKNLWATYSFSLFLIWCPLMLIPFLFNNGWKCWRIYGALILVFSIVLSIGLLNQPVR